MNSDSEELQVPMEDEDEAPSAGERDDEDDIQGDGSRAATGTGDAGKGSESDAGGDAAVGIPLVVQDSSKQGGAPRDRRRRRRGRGTAAASHPTAHSTVADAADAPVVSPARGSSEQPSSQRPTAGLGTDQEWAIPLMKAALSSAEACAYEDALEAFSRLLQRDYLIQLSREQLFTIEHQRVTGGWQTTVSLGDGRQVAGKVRARVKAAWKSAMEEAMAYLVSLIHYIALEARRLSEL